MERYRKRLESLGVDPDLERIKAMVADERARLFDARVGIEGYPTKQVPIDSLREWEHAVNALIEAVYREAKA